MTLKGNSFVIDRCAICRDMTDSECSPEGTVYCIKSGYRIITIDIQATVPDWCVIKEYQELHKHVLNTLIDLLGEFTIAIDPEFAQQIQAIQDARVIIRDNRRPK